MTQPIPPTSVRTIEPCKERPMPIPVAVIEGDMPSFCEEYWIHSNGYVEGSGLPVGCRLCSNLPGNQRYLRIAPMSRPVSVEANREGIYPPADEICICAECVESIMTLWAETVARD